MPTGKVPYLASMGSRRRGIDSTGEIGGTIICISSIGGVGGVGGSVVVIAFMPSLDIDRSGRGKSGDDGEEEEDGNGNSRHGARHCH